MFWTKNWTNMKKWTRHSWLRMLRSATPMIGDSKRLIEDWFFKTITCEPIGPIWCIFSRDSPKLWFMSSSHQHLRHVLNVIFQPSRWIPIQSLPTGQLSFWNSTSKIIQKMLNSLNNLILCILKLLKTNRKIKLNPK